MKIKVTLTLTDVNYRLLDAITELTNAPSINAWAAMSAVRDARSQLELHAKTNPRVAALLSETVPPPSNTAQRPDDATPSYERLSAEIHEILQTYDRDFPDNDEEDYEEHLQKCIGRREQAYPGFAQWHGKHFPQHRAIADRAIAWLAANRIK